MATQQLEMTTPPPAELKRVARWYFGGLASGIAACVTHPLDLVKVQMQTPGAQNPTFVRVAIRVAQSDGILALYNGLSASLLRQITYSLPRFGIYEVYKNSYPDRKIGFHEQLGVAGFSGLVGGLCGQPADLVNVRMQNDMKRPPIERRNYKHCFDGLWQVYKQGGVRELYNGATMMGGRSALMTVGQAVGYDQCKAFLIWSGYFEDNPRTHLCSGVGAAATAVLLTQPFDVMKTRMQNAPKGHYTGLLMVARDLITGEPATIQTASSGRPVSPSIWTRVFGFASFFKGITPAFIRAGPHTTLLFIFKEQLTGQFGSLKPSS